MADISLPRPYVIWTLQRTGGTSFNKFLNQHSPYPKTQDEPFNLPREHGEVSRDWRDNQDRPAMAAAVEDVAAQEHNIKHCVEKVHFAISRELVEATLRHSFVHLFLYRLDPVGRLLSMEYAERTRSWGRATVKPEGEDADAFDAPLPVDQLIEHETNANTKLNRFWRDLRAANAPLCAISYEELYAADTSISEQALSRLFSAWALDVPAESVPAITSAIRGSGGQGTADRYDRFEGLDELKARAGEIPPLQFRTRVFD